MVDDTSANRKLYKTLLENSGFHVLTADCGTAALELAQTSHPSLILLDYLMPGMNGIEVLATLRQREGTKRTPVVMLTASAEPDHIDAALGSGADDYITKPVNTKLLIARMKAMILARRPRERETRSKRTDAIMLDLKEAAHVQQSQLPKVPYAWNDWHLTGAVAPSGEVGGDLFDIVVARDRCMAFLLDVSGHGTASALVGAETRSELRHLLARHDIGAAMQRLNGHLSRRATGKYCCLAVVELHHERVSIVNAGLPPVAVLRGDRIVAQVWGSGMPVGMFDESVYQASDVPIESGDRIVLLSDGLTEPFGATDDAAAAVDRLSLWPTSTQSVPDGPALLDRIRKVSKESAPELRDDATALILSKSGQSNESLRIAAHPQEIPQAVRWVVGRCPLWTDVTAVDHGLTEALTNAILHGSLGLDSSVRQVGSYDQYLLLAQQLPEQPRLKDRTVCLDVFRLADSFGVRLTWEGFRCPPEARTSAPALEESPLSLQSSGMGLRIISTLFDRVIWAESGLSMEIWMDREIAERDRSLVPAQR